MLNKMHKNYDINKKYGIRKFTVGVFSVALGLIIVPEVGNIDFNGNIVKHEAKAAETTNVQLSLHPNSNRVLVDSNNNIEFEKNSFMKSKENIINKTLNFANKNTIEENRVFENPDNEKIKYGLDILTQNIVYNIKNNKIVITKPNVAKIEYSLKPVNTYSITEVEKGKYQIKHNYIINRATEDIYPLLKSLQDFNHEISNGRFISYSLSNPGISDKIDNYVRNLKSLREAEIRNNGVSKEQDITRMINLLKDAENELRTNYSVTGFTGAENEEVRNFMNNIDHEFVFFSLIGWGMPDTAISNFAYGANTTYAVIRKEDDKEVGTFTMNEKGVSNTLTLPDGEYKIVEKKSSPGLSYSTFAEDKDLTVRTVENSTDQVIYQATYNGKDIGNKVIVEQDGERVGKQYTVSLEEQEDKDTGLVYRPKQSSYTGTVKATNGITRVEYEPVMVNGPITFKPPFKSQVPIELFPEGRVQKGTASRVTLTDITDENGTVWTPNITKPRAGKLDEITYSIKEVRGKSLEQEQLEQGWQKAQRTDKVEIDYGNYLLIGSFSAPKFDGTIGSPAVYMFDKRANKDITHVYADRYNWSVWDSAQIVRGANKSLFKYDLNKASFYKKDNSLKAIVETADGRIETILSKGSHGGILVETKYTNKQGKTVNFGYSRYVDTYLDKNDRVSVFSLGNNDGVYMETDKYRLDYFMKVPDAPDNFDSRFYNKLSGIETNGRKDTPDMMTPNTLLLSKTVDSGIQMGWKDKPLANGETRTMAVEVKLSFASKINSEFSRNRESWDTNTTSRELYPNMPIKYDLTGTINPELLGNFTKATVTITVPEGISLVNNSVSILNGDNSVKSTLQGTYNANTRTFTVDVPKAETSNNSFKMRLNIQANQNVSKSYTFTEKIDVDNDINAGEKTNKSILNIIQNTRTVSVRYVDEQGNILKDSVISSQQRGTRYDVNSVNKPTTLNFNDVSYSYVRTNGSLTGTLTDNTVISHVYRPTRGANITVKYLAGTTEVVAPLVLEGNLNARIPTVNKPDVIRKNGKLYKLSTNNTDFSNTRFTNSTQSFTVNYDELATANYSYKKVINKNGVLETLGDPTVIYREGDKVGTSYNLTAPETFSLNGKKYKIKNVADKNISGQVKGTETTPVKNIEYNEVISSPINYQPVFRNSPLGTPKVIANTDTVVGSNYNVVPEEIIVNGIKYVPKNNRALTGVIDSGKTINVEYEEKQGNSIISYQPKFNGNNLGSPISVENQITNRREGANFEISPNNEITIDNKVYKLKNPTDKVRGTITQSPQTKEIEYVAKNSTNSITYQPKLNGNNLGNTIEITPITQVGTSYNVVPTDITVDGKVYEPVSKDALTGRTTESNTPLEVEYRAKQGNNEISYQPKFNGNDLGTPVSVKDQITDKQEGANFEISPNSEITIDNKVYKLKTPTDKVSGTITQSPQTKEIEYVEKNSNNNLVYQPKFNGSNLGDNIEITPITQIGTPYNVVPKYITVDGKVYEPVSKDALTGRVSENNTSLEVDYQPKLSSNDLTYQPKVNGKPIGNPIELVPSNSQVGTPYDVLPKDITVDGKVYEPVVKNNLTGRTTEANTPIEVEYRAKQGNNEISYQPKFNGNDLGTPVSVKDQITDKQEGANFEVSPNNEITVDNKVYKLKTPTDKVSGTITQSPQTKEIEYVEKNSSNGTSYQPKFNNDNLGLPIEITPITQVGTPYNVVPKDITVDGKVYEPTSKDALTGRVSEDNTPIEVNYQPKLSNTALNYQPKVNGENTGTPIEVVPSNSQIGTPYEITPKDITVNGRVYEPVSKDTITGKTTEANTPIEVEYRAKQGNDEISYQPKFNENNLGTPVSVKDQITDKQEGANFEISPNNEITIDNKVYKLKTPTDKVSGTITQSPQTKEIEYVEKNSNNNLTYQPKVNGANLGDNIEISPIAQIGTPYETTPKDITVDGKVYEPVSKDTLTGRVSENNTPIEVNYQPKLSNKALNYQPKVNGQAIGTPIEVVPSNSQVGTPYDLAPKEITIDGKVYEPVSKEKLTGRTTEDNTPIEVEYRVKQGNDEISYQPKVNNENLGTPISVKEQITDKQEGANFEITPNNEITIDNKVYKLKIPTDKVSGKITQSPQTKEIEYVAKNSNNSLEYQPKFNGTNLGDSIEIVPVSQIGTPYNVIPKEITIDGKVYEPVSKDALTGRVSENNSPIEVNYQPKLNSKALEYQPKVNGKELRKPIEILPSNSQIGTPYNVVPKKLLIDGKLYISVNKEALTGKLLENNETINVEYKESKDYNDTFKQFKEIEKDVIYVSADKDKKVAYDKELENLSKLLKGEKDPSDIEKSVANLEKLKEALNGKANLLKAIEKAKEEISKLTYIIPQSDPILDMLDEPSIIDVEEITHIVEDAKELNNTVKEIVEVLDKHNENEVDYKKSTPEKKEEYNKKAKEILEALKDKNLTKEKALEKVKELNKVSDNLDGIENKQKQDSAISEIEKNTDLPKEVKEKLIKEIENTTSSEDLNKLLDKGKFIDKEIKENKNVLSKQVNVSNLSDKEKEEYNKALKDYENALSNPNSTKEDIEKAKATLLKFIKEKNEVQFAKGMPAVLEKEEAFILEYKDENNKVIKTAIFPTSKKEDTDLLYPKELTSDNGEKYIRNSNNTYSLVVSNSKPLENKKEKSVVDEDNNNVKPITDKKDVVSTDKEVKTDNKEATIKKEELPKTSSSMLSTLGLFSIFGLRKNRKKDKQ